MESGVEVGVQTLHSQADQAAGLGLFDKVREAIFNPFSSESCTVELADDSGPTATALPGATAAICRREPRSGNRTDPSGQKLTVLE